jgi:MoxR-like ATPase
MTANTARTPAPAPDLATADAVRDALRAQGYLTDHALATAVFLALRMQRPLLLEGEAGVGKTEAGKALTRVLGAEFIRLQCYEGIDSAQALYEWDYPRQLLAARIAAEREADRPLRVTDLYSSEFLLERPLLHAIRAGHSAVLLIDELDRADDEFEAFLLEVLSDYTLTIPELGTITTHQPPVVVITSNRTRELHDALKRRCLYHWIEFPDVDREVEIIRLRLPDVSERLARSIAETVGRIRDIGLVKPPGVAEAIDWARAFELLDCPEMEPGLANATLGAVVKNREDAELVKDRLDELLDA